MLHAALRVLVDIFNFFPMQWAFGVTCWEMCTGGKIPYAGIHPSDLPLVIERGHRLEKPDNAACIDKV